MNRLHGNEVCFRNQCRVDWLFGDGPFLQGVPASGLHKAEQVVGVIIEVVVGVLAIPYLPAGVARVGQDRRDGVALPRLPGAVRVTGGVGR
jgi:hypothetical protein